MIFLLGVALVSAPYFSLTKSIDPARSFIEITFLSVVFHTILAVTTLSFGLFLHPVILISTILFSISTSIYFFRKNRKLSIYSFSFPYFIAFIILAFEFLSVRFWYTGEVSTVFGNILHTTTRFTHPFFSDEWLAVAFSNRIHEIGSLPLFNPFAVEQPVANFFILFHSLHAELTFLFGQSPVSSFWIFALLAGLGLATTVYIAARALGVSRFAASISMLLAGLITVGANLPGSWNFIPFTFGLILFLLTFISCVRNYMSLSFIGAFLTVLFYPPLLALVIPLLIGYSISHKNYTFVAYAGGVVATGILLILLFIGLSESLEFRSTVSLALQYLVRPSVISNGIPLFRPYYVLPITTLLFFIYSVPQIRKNLIVLLPLFVGTLYWIYYSFTAVDVLISYERIVVATSLLVTIAAAIGIQNALRFLQGKITVTNQAQRYYQFAAMSFVYLVFAVTAFFYTELNDWQKLTLALRPNPNSKEIHMITPAPPVNRYYTNEDARIFSTLNNIRFLSHPWKGLVIGATTNNIPLHTKDSTVTVREISYNGFMGSDCDTKTLLMEKHRIDYVYTEPLHCEGFEAVDRSIEGLTLYRLKHNTISQ